MYIKLGIYQGSTVYVKTDHSGQPETIPIVKYRCLSLYAIDRDQKYMFTFNKFAYKKTKDDCKLEDRIKKMKLITRNGT